MIMIAVLNANVHAGVRHPARDLSELSRFSLPERLNENLIVFDDADSRRGQGCPSSCSVVKKKMSDAHPIRDENAAAFDTHSGAAERLAHLRESTGPVVEGDAEVFHAMRIVRGIGPGVA